MLRAWFYTPRLGSLRLSREWRGEPTCIPPRHTRPGICRTAFEFLAFLRPEDCRERLERLLKGPDAPDLRGTCYPDQLRGNVLRQEGASDRFRRWLPIRVRAIRARELAQLGLADAEEDLKKPDAPNAVQPGKSTA